jgi:hypothetical protein
MVGLLKHLFSEIELTFILIDRRMEMDKEIRGIDAKWLSNLETDQITDLTNKFSEKYLLETPILKEN